MYKIGDEVIVINPNSQYFKQKGIIKEYAKDFDYVVQIEGQTVLLLKDDIQPFKKAFTKDDFKDGMIVTLRKGVTGIVFKEYILTILISKPLEDYYDDLKYVGSKEGKHDFDIMKVQSIDGKILWERQ